jgi:hypothetical protein
MVTNVNKCKVVHKQNPLEAATTKEKACFATT